jgi:hypothetical protein
VSATACPQVPPSLTREFYAALCGRSKGRDVPVIFDRPLEGIQATLRAVQATLAAHTAVLARIQTNLEKIAMSQSDIDAAVTTDTALLTDLTTQTAAIGTAQTALEAEIGALKTANPALDLSGLDAVNTQLQAAQPALDTAVAGLTAASDGVPPAPATPPVTSAAESANPGIAN